MEEEAIGSKRKAPSCSRCSNHGQNAPLTHHKCPYEECDCLLCKLTWARKIVMRRQQQLWRQRKETQKWEEAAAEGGETEGSGGKQKQKYCDMCRNHGTLMKNRGHKRLCQYENCPCDLCSFTRKRRQIMQLQQKVKRSNITTQQFQEANEWVTKLTLELASLGIDDVPNISTLISPMPVSSNIPSHGHPFPASSATENPFPSTFPAGLIPASHPVESFPPAAVAVAAAAAATSSAASSHITRNFVPSASALEQQYPSTSFPMETNSPSIAAAAASSFSSSANAMHIPMASSSSYTSLYPSPSPCYTSPSASPISDYDISFPTCPSPLLSYPCTDNTSREMTSHPQQTCAVIRNTPSAEPLDCSDHPAHSSRSHKYAENRLPEPSESPIIHHNRSVYSKLHSNTLGWGNEQGNVEEVTQEKYWPSQRRNSDGVIQPSYKQNQRRNSDSVIQGIYRPSQRRNSDGVIKRFYVQNQRGNSDEVIQEICVPEERRNNDDEIPQRRYKTDLGDSSEEVIEECYRTEVRIQSIQQLDQRRNSDGGILTSYRSNERRNSDGVIRKGLGWNQKGNYAQNYAFNPSETSDEVTYDTYYRQSERRSSDEASQGSYGVDQRRNSVETYGSSERGNIDEVNKSYYWTYARSDSGEAIHDTNWPKHRRDSDEFIQGNYQPNKDHFFENNLRREHEVCERLDRVIPMDDNSMNLSSDGRPYFKDHPPMRENCPEAATGTLNKPIAARGDEDTNLQDNRMNWSDHHAHEETNLHSESLLEQNYEEMDRPLDLTTRSSAKH